ncbi:MAG TPA: hypothetical protein VF905_10440 [Nitrospirota bacterium]
MTILPPPLMKALKDLKKTVPRCPYCGSPDLEHKAQTNTCIIARIEWCRLQRMHAPNQAESERLRAEEEGLLDALLYRDHTDEYQYSPPGMLERYAMGLEDGRALIRLAKVDYL